MTYIEHGKAISEDEVDAALNEAVLVVVATIVVVE